MGVPGPICLLCAKRCPKDGHRMLIGDYLELGEGHEIEHLAP